MPTSSSPARGSQRRTNSVKPPTTSLERASVDNNTAVAATATTKAATPTSLFPPNRAPVLSARTSALLASAASPRRPTSNVISSVPSSPTHYAAADTHIIGNGVTRAKTRPYLEESDFADSAYRAHTVVFLLGLCAAIAYAANMMTGSFDVSLNTKVGLGAVAIAFITFCAVYLPDELMVRPHPAVWRALIAVNLLYASLVLFLIFQDVPTIRGYLAAIDPKLKNDLPERSYAEDCRLSTPEDPYKWFHTIFDEFLIAHSLGYFCKMLIIRDWRLVVIISVLFEVVELSLQHILPNFKECWWDHLIIDILICNAGGMVAGMIFLKVMGIRQYQWVKLADIKSVSGKLKRVATQLYPREIERYEWAMFSSPKRLFWCMFLVAFNLTQEFNCFTMKSILHLPSNHYLVIGRLMTWGFFALGGCRGLYVYAIEEGPLRAKRVPMAAWAAFTTLFFECVWIYKMKREGNHFQEPMPAYVGVPLYTAFLLFGIWFVLNFGFAHLREKHFYFRTATNVIFYLIPVCLISLFVMTNVDMQWGQKPFMRFVETFRPYGFGPLEEGHGLSASQRAKLGIAAGSATNNAEL